MCIALWIFLKVSLCVGISYTYAVFDPGRRFVLCSTATTELSWMGGRAGIILIIMDRVQSFASARHFTRESVGI